MNRIYFKDNPWPNGHSIKEFEWEARLEPDSGIWFDLHLKSEDYDADDIVEEEEEEEEDDRPDWYHKIVWNNYHAVTLSSTFWGHKGLLVGTEANHLDFTKLAHTTFEVDTLPLQDERDYEDGAFGIYLLGHDAAADHRIHFEKNTGSIDFTVRWSGKIALMYAGQEEFKYDFDATITNAAFSGIKLPEGYSPEKGRLLLASFVSDVDLFVWSHERERFVLRS